MPMPKVKRCTFCDGLGHYSFTCSRKPRKSLGTKKTMRKAGKYYKKWTEVRDKWLEKNKAEYYVCYIPGCSKIMTRSQLTLDHIKSRSRYPELRYVLKNLAPCCARHNQDKGSLSLEEYLRKISDGQTKSI